MGSNSHTQEDILSKCLFSQHLNTTRAILREEKVARKPGAGIIPSERAILLFPQYLQLHSNSHSRRFILCWQSVCFPNSSTPRGQSSGKRRWHASLVRGSFQVREPFFCFRNIYNCIPIHTQEDILSKCLFSQHLNTTRAILREEKVARKPGAGIIPSERAILLFPQYLQLHSNSHSRRFILCWQSVCFPNTSTPRGQSSGKRRWRASTWCGDQSK